MVDHNAPRGCNPHAGNPGMPQPTPRMLRACPWAVLPCDTCAPTKGATRLGTASRLRRGLGMEISRAISGTPQESLTAAAFGHGGRLVASATGPEGIVLARSCGDRPWCSQRVSTDVAARTVLRSFVQEHHTTLAFPPQLPAKRIVHETFLRHFLLGMRRHCRRPDEQKFLTASHNLN